MHSNIPVCRCIEKKRDNSGNVTEFLLEDSKGNKKAFTKDNLKLAMTNKKIEVLNLQIDGGGRLVDKAETKSNHPIHSSTPNRPIQDMTNKELFEYMKGIDDAEKLSNEQLLRIIKEIYKRCVNTDDRFNQLMSNEIPEMLSQIQQLQSQLQSQDSTSMQTQMDSIQSYLEQNKDRLDEIKTNMEQLTTQLSTIGTGTDSTNAEESHLIIPTSGKFIYPDDEVSKFFYQQVFTEDSTGLVNIENENVLEALKSEITEIYEAYNYTEQFYISQFEEHSE